MSQKPFESQATDHAGEHAHEPGPATEPLATQPGAAAEPTRDVRTAAPGDNPLRHSRTSGLWTAVIAAAVLLLLLLVFIVQNTESVPIAFLGWDTHLPLAVALLVATAVGMLVVGAVGSLRILQLRRRVKRERRHA